MRRLKPDAPYQERVGSVQAAALLLSFGCKLATIATVTRLTPSEIRVLRGESYRSAGNTTRDSCSRLLSRSTLTAVQCSWAVCCFDSLVESGGMTPRDALVRAYASYVARFQCPQLASRLARGRPPHQSIITAQALTIDNVFQLVSVTFGLWGAAKTLNLHTCSRCRARFVSEPLQPSLAHTQCPFCKLASRYNHDSRIRQFLDSACRMSVTTVDVDKVISAFTPPLRPPVAVSMRETSV